jgi:hypothetical protein
MEESFKLPVLWNGREQEIDVTLRVTGFSPRFIASVNGAEVTIEKDEEGSYRAIQFNQDVSAIKDRDLIAAIVNTIQEAFGS